MRRAAVNSRVAFKFNGVFETWKFGKNTETFAKNGLSSVSAEDVYLAFVNHIRMSTQIKPISTFEGTVHLFDVAA
jgi:hypothetical protein